MTYYKGTLLTAVSLNKIWSHMQSCLLIMIKPTHPLIFRYVVSLFYMQVINYQCRSNR